MDSLVAALRKPACPAAGPQWRSDPIELSNACRAFYQCRLETARALKERWGRTGPPSRLPGDTTHRHHTASDRNDNCRKRSSIDVAMEKLRQEMTSLMEQDLTLMKQLLTLNEEIEELKWRRRYGGGWSHTSSTLTWSGDVPLGSLGSFTSSDASLGWWRGESGDPLPAKYPGISSLSLHADIARLSVYDEEDSATTFNLRAVRGDCSDGDRGSQRTLTVDSDGGPDQCPQQQQQRPGQVPAGVEKDCTERESFDSGIHEGYTAAAVRTNSVTEMTHL